MSVPIPRDSPRKGYAAKSNFAKSLILLDHQHMRDRQHTLRYRFSSKLQGPFMFEDTQDARWQAYLDMCRTLRDACPWYTQYATPAGETRDANKYTRTLLHDFHQTELEARRNDPARSSSKPSRLPDPQVSAPIVLNLPALAQRHAFMLYYYRWPPLTTKFKTWLSEHDQSQETLATIDKCAKSGDEQELRQLIQGLTDTLAAFKKPPQATQQNTQAS